MDLPTGTLQFFPVQYHRHQVATGRAGGPAAGRASRVTHGHIWFGDSFDQPRNGGANRHDAIDIMGPIGVRVLAPVAGTVADSWSVGGQSRPGVGITGDGDGGFYVVLIGREGGLYHYFSHLDDRPAVTSGEEISAGHLLGYLGHSGRAHGNPHLHYQVSRRNEHGALRRFYNPYKELRRLAGPLGETRRTSTRVDLRLTGA